MPDKKTIDHGYIKLFRKFFDSELWQEPRKYSKAEAWIDLIEMARWSEEPDKRIDSRGEYILEFGDIYISMRFLSVRWKWSTTKVCKYLAYMEVRKSILFKKKDSHRTIINLINLRTYLGWGNQEKDSEVTEKKQRKDRKKTKKKTVKTLDPVEPIKVIDGVDGKVFENFIGYRKERGEELTERASTIAQNVLVKHNKDEQKIMVDRAILNNWKGLFPLKESEREGEDRFAFLKEGKE